MTSLELDEAIQLSKKEMDMAAPSKCFNAELMAWILTEIKSLLFRPDGAKRNSMLVNKGRLIVFALALAGKVAKCLFENRRRRTNLPDIQP